MPFLLSNPCQEFPGAAGSRGKHLTRKRRGRSCSRGVWLFSTTRLNLKVVFLHRGFQRRFMLDPAIINRSLTDCVPSDLLTSNLFFRGGMMVSNM